MMLSSRDGRGAVNGDGFEGGNERQEEEEDSRYPIPSRSLSAVEIPAVVQDVDRAVRAFGRVPTLKHTLEPNRNSIPLYLNPESPFCKPIMSHNTRTHNVVLKVTVPKRTGRKRKRGSDEPWQGDTGISGTADSASLPEQISSRSRLDDPRVLRRKLQDNADAYTVEAVGVIKHTHRFRGLADFYWDMSKSSLAQRYVDQVLPGDVEQLKHFKFVPGVDAGPNVDILPPPMFTHMGLPFNYFFSQNPYVRTTEDGDTVNLTAVKQVGYFISADDPSPTAPKIAPDMTDARLVEIIAQIEAAFEERPVWTRRSLLNHLGGKLRSWNELKKYLNYTAYQFKGGPWRDGVVPYGLDPRSDPKYRIYQTLMFKLQTHRKTEGNRTWHSMRSAATGGTKEGPADPDSHIFDGETFHNDGKVWQVCDIHDPLLKELFDNAEVRPTWDGASGWYHGGLWAKAKAIMKTKLVAAQFGRRLTRQDFATTLRVRDASPTNRPGPTSNFHIPLPNLGLTDEELTIMRGREPSRPNRYPVYNVRMKNLGKKPSSVPESSTPTAAQDSESNILAQAYQESDDGDSGSGGGSDLEDDPSLQEYPELETQEAVEEEEEEDDFEDIYGE